MTWIAKAVQDSARRAWAGVTGLALLTGIAGCGLVGGPSTFQADVPNRMTVTSPDMTDGILGSAYTCYGKGGHPGVHWSGAPANTQSFALVMDDSAAPIRPYVYWIVFDIGSQRTAIEPGRIPPGARQSRNSKGTVGYDPPCPVNQAHTYRFTIYALRHRLHLRPGASLLATWSAIAQAALVRGRLTASANP